MILVDFGKRYILEVEDIILSAVPSVQDRVEQRSGSGLNSTICMKSSIQFRDPIPPTN